MKLLFLSKFTMCMTVYFLADDAGISNTATSYIAEAWQQNLLDGFSIVANSDCSKQLQNILQNNRQRECILAAHLNLTDGKSIAMHGNDAIIADDRGRLRISFIKALYLVIRGGKRKQRFLQEVQTEWNAQLNFIKNICGDRELSIVNGHNHLHMIPSLFQIATELSKNHNIPCVRIAKEHFSIQSFDIFFQPFFYFNSFKIIILSICRFLVRKEIVKYHSFTEEAFGILFSGNLSKERVLTALSNASKRKVQSIEIIFHPGQSTVREMNEWASYKSGKKFFVHSNRKKELEILKQLRNAQ